MNDLLHIGASGLLAHNAQLNSIGNNIANSSTTGYKASRVSFAESFYQAGSREPNGTVNAFGQGVNTAGVTNDWSTGAADETGVETHLAIGGNGFLPVRLGADSLYTRNGSFAWADYSVLSEGAGTGYVLALPSGAMLLDSTQQLLRFDAKPTAMTIGANGKIQVSDAAIVEGSDQLGLQLFTNPNALLPVEGGLYEQSADASPLTAAPVTPGTQGAGPLRQGSLETSNVDLVTEFTSMISAQRAFQASSRSVTTADELLQEIMNLKR
jgi:flagellar hook protein FlgE